MTGPAYLASDTVLRERYEILREIGRGGYSVVYLARDRQIDGQVAVKLLVPPPAGAQVARERMRREVQAVRGLSHANIVAVFDFLEEGPWSFIVMEYVAGPDLQVRVRERGPLDGDEAVQLGRGIAAALAAAHRRGILHRDVKPQNILLDPDGRARLTDFGSAKLDGQVGVTATGALAGTLIYSAPEVLAGRRGDARADIYALGLTLYYALTGELPERPSSQVPPVPLPGGFHPRSIVGTIPEWLDQIMADLPQEHQVPATQVAPSSSRGPSEIELLSALYADSEVRGVLDKHDVPVVTLTAPAWKRFPAPQPLTAALVGDLYEGCGLSLHHIELLTGRPAAAVGAVLRTSGVKLRPASGRSPFMERWRLGKT